MSGKPGIHLDLSSFIDTSTAQPSNPLTEATKARAARAAVKKPKRATAAEKAEYYKSTTLMLTKPRYIRLKAAMARHDRMAQELLVELVDRWLDKMDRKDGLRVDTPPAIEDLEELREQAARLQEQIAELEARKVK